MVCQESMSSSDRISPLSPAQSRLLGEFPQRTIARILPMIEAAAGQRPPAVEADAVAGRDATEQEPIRRVQADGVGADPRDLRRVGHRFPYASAPRK
jgi:hypothetical protein